MKFLVVDDQRINLILMEALLTSYVGDVVYETSSLEALKRLQKDKIDILITDYIMPNLNGVELLNFAKKMNPETYCIIISVDYHKEFILSDDYLVKPILKVNFDDAMDKAINHYHSILQKKAQL